MISSCKYYVEHKTKLNACKLFIVAVVLSFILTLKSDKCPDMQKDGRAREICLTSFLWMKGPQSNRSFVALRADVSASQVKHVQPYLDLDTCTLTPTAAGLRWRFADSFFCRGNVVEAIISKLS